MAERPKFGITEDPDVVEQKRKASIEATGAEKTALSPEEKVFSTAEKHTGATPSSAANESNERKQASPAPTVSFGADTDTNHKRNGQSIFGIFSLFPKSFWLKAYGFSIVGAAVWIFQSAGNQPTTWKTALLVANLVLYPFTSALLKAYGSHTHLPVPRIAYILLGTNDQMEKGLGGSLMTLIIWWARFVVFIYEWRFSVILGLIGILVMRKQLK